MSKLDQLHFLLAKQMKNRTNNKVETDTNKKDSQQSLKQCRYDSVNQAEKLLGDFFCCMCHCVLLNQTQNTPK